MGRHDPRQDAVGAVGRMSPPAGAFLHAGYRLASDGLVYLDTGARDSAARD